MDFSAIYDSLVHVAACLALPIVWGCAVHLIFETARRARRSSPPGSASAGDVDDESLP